MSLWNLDTLSISETGHLDWKIFFSFFFNGPLQKHLHTWLLHLLAAFIVHACHCGCTCLAPIIPCALRKENHLARKDSKCTSDLSPPSPSSVWQSKTYESPLKLSRMWLFTIRVQGLCVENVIHDSSLLTTPVIIFYNPLKPTADF